ncbi:von Willebrand factor type A domain-containing protein [Gracilibacillus ureilyticus]|uniref:von Willebrand factor type A domain-containing protein n=1 Tax=Gracilibacillus ureilyticus TaxID=531814 RepID=A0A1H9TX08_9BACI|nr:VWA domain-containing protein [Gracilibacillus ureilyticus]SES01755.1 von Willebrand factor type A domain-containing protein [Gracilibacillus ureilyticus]
MAFQVDNPLWLLGFIPAAVVLYLYWKSNSTLAGGRKIVLTVLRTLVFTLVILALAGIQILWPIQQLATVFVVDRSYSLGDNEKNALEQVNDAVDQKALEDQAGIISLAREAVVETPLSNHVDGINSFQTEMNQSYSNLASGLQLAGSMFSSGDKGRVVLLTDGNENIGDAVRQASYLKRRDYVVDVLPFSTVYKEDVAITSFDVPENIYLGEQAPMSVTIDSSMDTTSQIRISKDGETIIDQTVEINEGSNQMSFQHLISDDGFHTFHAEIVSEGDQVVENNQLSAFAETKGLPHVLIVEGKSDAAANMEKALNASAVQVETIPPELLPVQLSNFLKYDSIIFSNVSAHMVTAEQMELIERAVQDFGVGFVMTGGDQSFGVGGYFKTPIEKLMPVDMDLQGKNELPSLGLSIVLDKSGSMSGTKIALAREAAARSVALLREKDTLGVTAFDSVPWEVVELGPINDKEEVENKIRSITASGGTDIFTPLSQSYEEMKPLELKRKHVILLTDGQSATSMNYREMIEEARESGITLSTVAIGMEADGLLLEEMAELGGGRFYQVQNNSTIPTILSRETAMVTRTYIEDNPFYPAVSNGYGWGAYFENGVPQMNAYIATTPKGRAQQILTSEKGDPVLARWQYGLGKTVAWTSDLSGEWAGDWPAWENWSPIWNDIITWTFPQYQKQSYQISKKIEGNQVTLNVTSADSNPASLQANLVSETGEEVAFNLEPKAPGEYEGTFEADESGVYFLQITEQQNGEAVSSFKTGVVVPYSEEYTFKPANEHVMEEIASAGGGQVLENLDNSFSPDGLPPRYDRQDLFYLFLSLALVLFMLDVAVRRFRISSAFVNTISSNIENRRTKVSEGTDKRASQLSQLKKASTKNTAKQSMPASTEKKQPDPLKNVTAKRKTESPRPVAKSGNGKNNNGGESREEKMARLLNAKKRGKK